MGRKRRADALDNDTNKESEVPNGTSITSNDSMDTTTQINTTSTITGKQPVTAAKTSAAIVVATPGSVPSSEQKSKVFKVSNSMLKYKNSFNSILIINE